MKKVFVFGYAIIVLMFFLAGLVYSQSLEEIKAQARSEVRREMGLDKPEKPDVQQPKKVYSLAKIGPETIQKVALIAMVIALIPATIAKVKGRSFIAWWVLGLLCFIVVFPISVYMKKLPAGIQSPDKH